MPNTRPVCSDAETAHAVQQKAEAIGLCGANQCVSITKDFDGRTLDHLLTLPEDIRFISEDGHGVQNNAVMARAFAIATERGLTVMSHAEDMEVSPWDYRLAENLETLRNCHLAEYYGTRLHMCHVSTREAVDMVRQSRRRGALVTCEVTPHHLWFDDKRLQYRVNPPIRTRDDVKALVDAIKDGTVSCIGTDHAPHTAEDKAKGAADGRARDRLCGLLHQALPHGGPAAGDAELFDELRPRAGARPSTTARACWPPATTQTSRWSTSTTCIRSKPPNCTPRAKQPLRRRTSLRPRRHNDQARPDHLPERAVKGVERK